MNDFGNGVFYLGSFRVPYSGMLFAGAFLLTLCLTPLVRMLALRAGALDHPGPRRIHERPVPTMGGLAIAIATLGTAWAAYFLPGPVARLGERPLMGLTVAGLLIVTLGIVDDLKRLPALAKLAVQVGAALILVAFGYGVPELSSPFGGSFHLGLLNVPLTVLWVVVVTNAINLIDGLDGLAAGAVCIASMSLWWVGRSHLDLYVMLIAALLAGSTLAFLRYNFPPARIFMGDTGSQFLGLSLAALSLIENRKGTVSITLLFPLVAMGVPIFDSGLALVRRLVSRQPVFRGDSEHIHHRMLRLGLSRRAAVLVLWYLCIFLGVMAVVVEALPRNYVWFVLVLLGMGIFMAFEILEFVDRRTSAKGRGDRPPES